MRSALALLAFAASLVAADPVAAPFPGGVSSNVAPAQSPPADCSPNYDGTFELNPINATTHEKRLVIGGLEKRLNNDTQLGITLKAGVLTDPMGRTGYIASNYQFQFDDPPQAGAIWTAGFSICRNGSLALGNDARFFKCYNIAEAFYNLYSESIGAQCVRAFLVAQPMGNGHPASVPASLSTVDYKSSPATITSHGSDYTHYGTAGLTNVVAASASSRAASMSRASARTTKKATAAGAGAQNTSGSGSGTSSASSSSSSGGAVAGHFKGEAMGLAAGLLALFMW